MGIRGCVDLAGKSAAEVEMSGSRIEPGWYRAAVADVYEDDRSNLKLVFRLADGREHIETLFHPANSEKPRRLEQRRSVFSIRMGLVPREAKGQAYEFDWLDAIGREVVIEMTERPDDKGRKFVGINWVEVYAADDQRVQEHVKGQPRLIDAAAQRTASAPVAAREPAAFDLSDL